MSTAPAAKITAASFSEPAFETFVKSRDEPDWLRSRRKEAFEAFQSAPWPTLRDEEWRRTDIRAFKLGSFQPPIPHDPSSEAREALTPAWETLKRDLRGGD